MSIINKAVEDAVFEKKNSEPQHRLQYTAPLASAQCNDANEEEVE